MSIAINLNYTCDLRQPVTRRLLPGLLGGGDARAHTLAVAVVRDGEAVDLTDAAVNAYLIRADGQTVLAAGSAAGNVAAVTLPAACYLTPGRCTLLLRVTLAGATQTVLVLDGAVAEGTTDTLVDPENVVPSLDELLQQITVLEQATAEANAAAGSAAAATAQAQTAAGLLTGLTVSAAQAIEASAQVSTADGHYHLALTMPQGRDGVVGSLGTTMWSVAVSAAGDLILTYPDGATAPPLSLNADGDLIYTTD